MTIFTTPLSSGEVLSSPRPRRRAKIPGSWGICLKSQIKAVIKSVWIPISLFISSPTHLPATNTDRFRFGDRIIAEAVGRKPQISPSGPVAKSSPCSENPRSNLHWGLDVHAKRCRPFLITLILQFGLSFCLINTTDGKLTSK